MADNIQQIRILKNEWTDIYAALAPAGVAIGDPIFIENVGASDVFLAVQAAEPTKKHTAYNVLKYNDPILMGNTAGDVGAWAYCNATEGLLSVSTTAPNGFVRQLKVLLADGYGNPIGSLKGALDIHDADVHNAVINRYMHRHTGVETTLTTEIIGDGTEYTIDVADVTGFALLDYIHINTTTEERTHPRVIQSSVALPGSGPGTFTLDRFLDLPHPVGDGVTQSVIDMSSVAGSMAAPVIYYAAPYGDQIWHVTRIMFELTHGTAGDLGLFGDLPALTNGVQLRARIGGLYYTFTNWKQNSQMKVDMYDVQFDPRSGGGGQYGTTGRGTFTNAGAVLRLDGAAGDRLELLVLDDITALDSFTMKAQGHPEDQ